MHWTGKAAICAGLGTLLIGLGTVIYGLTEWPDTEEKPLTVVIVGMLLIVAGLVAVAWLAAVRDWD